eukprot:1151224-Pelagomonas_calceolata.AAC.3
MVSVGVHPAHCLICTPEEYVVNVVYIIAKRTSSRTGRKLEKGVADLLVSKLKDWVVCFSVCSGCGWYGTVKFLPSLVVVARDASR